MMDRMVYESFAHYSAYTSVQKFVLNKIFLMF